MLLQKHAALLQGAVMPMAIPQYKVVGVQPRGAIVAPVVLAGVCPRNNGQGNTCVNGNYTCKYYTHHTINNYRAIHIRCRK